jgi:putative transposase
MISRRLKPTGRDVVYHLVSRVPQGDFLWETAELKDRIRNLLWRAADFSGVEIITYTLMSNHFHVLVRVPEQLAAETRVTDDELVRRLGRLNGAKAAQLLQSLRPEVCRAEAVRLDGHELDPTADAVVVTRWEKRRAQLLRRMHDVSEFMKCFKERVSAWYNTTHHTHGTVWGARFKSLVVENRAEALRAVALYIDLNPVRAGLVDDPKDYRWCGYAEAVAGHRCLRQELASLMERTTWTEGGPSYRLWLAGKGRVEDRLRQKKAMSDEVVAEIEAHRGELEPSESLRQRIRHFTDGGALGRPSFIAAMFAEAKAALGYRQNKTPHPVDVPDTEGEWATFVRLSRSARLPGSK